MRLNSYLITELASDYGKGITFIDVDETMFHTFAKIIVKDENTGRVIRKLSNQEFNTYELKPGEEFDFHEFRDAEFFKKTSIPIPQTVKRIRRMLRNIDRRDSRIVFLTARATFENQQEFYKTFQEQGIPIEKLHVEFAGDKKGTVAQVKKNIILDYLKSGLYRRVRLVDDAISNLRAFLKLKDTIPQSIVDKVKKNHNITGEESIPPIEFYALLVEPSGKLRRIE